MPEFAPGDLLFFWGTQWQSRVIEFVTRGPSHVGIVCPYDYYQVSDGRRFTKTDVPLLFESTTLCALPDEIARRRIDGVQAHLPDERARWYDGRVARMRLRPGRTLQNTEVRALTHWLEQLHGRPYDVRGAIASGTRLFKWTPLLPYPDLGHVFCSELCAEMLMRLNRLPLGDPSVYNPASLLRALLRCASYLPPEEISAAIAP